MPVLAKCGDCGKQFRIRDELAGKVLPCKNCGADFRVPSARGTGAAPPKRRPASPPPRRNDELFEEDFAPGGGSSTIWIIGGAAIGVIILGVAIAIFVFAGKDKADDGDANNNGDNVAQNDGDQNPPLDGDNNPLNNGDNNNPPLKNNVGDGGNAGNGGNNDPANNNNNGDPIAKQGGGGLQPPPAGNNNVPIGGNNNPPLGNGIRQPGGLVPVGQEKKPALDPSHAANWTMKVDTPAEPIEFNNKDKLTLRSPKAFFADAWYPKSSSAVVALGALTRENEYRDVYDLRSGQLIGRIGGIKLGFGKTYAISPLGSYFATISRETNGIWLWDIKNRKQLGTLPLDDKTASSGRLEILDFAGTQRIVAAGRDTPLWIWKHPFDKPAKTIELGKTWDFDKESVAYSGGGRYMTIYHKKVKDVVAYDLETGKETGRIMIPKDISLSGCKGMAFSPDGTELAALFQFISRTRLFVWDVKTGRELVQHKFEMKRGHYKGPALQWFPDKKKWLVLGNFVIDREAGKPVWQIPKIPDARDEARLLGADRIALFGKPSGGAFVSTMPVPHDKIAKATRIVQSGGTTADVDLPELKPANWKTARAIVADGVAGAWKAGPDPAPAGAPADGATTIDTSFGRVTGVRVARRDVARAVTLSESSTSGAANRGGRAGRGGLKLQNPNQNATPVVRLDLYDLKTRQRADTMTLTYKSDLMAVSPSGGHALVRYKTGEDRLDVWSLGEKKHVCGFKPYVDEKHAHHRKVTEAMFVDEEHVLTVNSNNRIAVWKLPECKAVYVINGAKNPIVSPNGKYVCVSTNKAFRLFDARTGEPAGDLVMQSGTHTGGAFHPDGERFAGIGFSGGANKIAVWNLTTGKAESEFMLPTIAGIGRMHWCGDQHVLVENRRLVDLKSKMVVWSYSLPGGTHVDDSPDGKHWYLAGTRPMSLTGLTMPDAVVKRQTAGKNLQPNYVLKPGMEVAISVQINGIHGQGNLNQELYNTWKQRLENAGVKVVQKADLVLFARTTTQQTGRTETFTISTRQFGFMPRGGFRGRAGIGGANARTETVSDSVINCRIVFGKGGKAYGEVKRPIKKLPVSVRFYRASIKKGESAESHFSNRQQLAAASFFKRYVPPAYLFDDSTRDGLGSSQLVAGGSR